MRVDALALRSLRQHHDITRHIPISRTKKLAGFDDTPTPKHSVQMSRAKAFLNFDFAANEKWTKLEKNIELPAEITEDQRLVPFCFDLNVLCIAQ
jgi:hypothetical protein